MEQDLKVVMFRYLMPYDNLVAQKDQRFSVVDDLEKHECTIEMMGKYELHIDRGNIVHAGVDNEAILEAAENDPDDCDVILWDGGNNNFSFFEADLAIAVVDPHRPGHELNYYPGGVSLQIADVALINKVDSATPENIAIVEENIKKVNPTAQIIKAEFIITIDHQELIKEKKVLYSRRRPNIGPG